MTSELPKAAQQLFKTAGQGHEPSRERLERNRVAIHARIAAAGSETAQYSAHARGPLYRRGAIWKWSVLSVFAVCAGLLGLRGSEPPDEATKAARSAAIAPSADAAVLPARADRGSLHSADSARAGSRAAPSGAQDAHSPAVVALDLVSPAQPAATRPPSSPIVRAPTKPTRARHDDAIAVAASGSRRATTSSVAARAETAELPHAESVGSESPTVFRRSQAQPEDRLADEVSLIASARRAVDRRDLVDAERALARHVAEFPAGQLLTERVAIETRVRCLAGDRVGARARYRELELLGTPSALRRAVLRACGAVLKP
ncbi:MAG: hypothetical protein RLZZ450_2952 [Pseudomonadota bacterium]